MARPYPKEFRDDVVRVARNREDGVTIEQIAADFGVHPMTLSKWLRRADIDDGATPGRTTGESAELRELRRRNRLLEQENEGDDLERLCQGVSPNDEPCDYPATVHCVTCAKWFCDAHAEDDQWHPCMLPPGEEGGEA